MRLDLLAVRIQEFRRRFKELSAAQFSDRTITQFSHAVELDMAKRTKGIVDKRSFSLVASQQQYIMADDIIGIESMVYDPTIVQWPIREWPRKRLLAQMYTSSSQPQVYALSGKEKKIWMWPTPDTSAQTTTVTGSHTAIVTTITVASTDGFGTQGRIKIGNEVISYTAMTSTTFTGCIRGEENTIPQALSGSETVTWNNVEMFCSIKPPPLYRVYSTGTTATTVNSATLTGSSTLWNTGRNVQVGDWFGLGAYDTTPTAGTFPNNWYKISSITSDTVATLATEYVQITASTTNYIITQQSLFPEEDGETIVKGMIVVALFMTRSPLFLALRKEYDQLVDDGSTTHFPEDWLPTNQDRDGPTRYGPQPDNQYYPAQVW